MSLRQREPRVRLQKWLDAAEGEECTLRHPLYCMGGTETTVAAHANWGKGVGMKADDTMIVFCCRDCHLWLDASRDPDRPRMWLAAHGRTLRRLWEKGLLG